MFDLQGMIDKASEAIEDAVGLIGHALTLFYRYPLLIVPLAGSWCVYALIVLVMEFQVITISPIFPWFLLQALLIYFLLTFSVSMASLVSLAMLRQVESGHSIKLFSAIGATLQRQTVRVVPIALIWALLWLALSAISAVLSALFGGKSLPDSGRSEEISFEAAAKTLAGSDQNGYRENDSITAMKAGLRLFVFLVLPGIIWTNRKPIEAVKHAYRIAMDDWGAMASEFIASEFMALATSIPLALFFIVANSFQGTFPDFVWIIVIVYCAAAWSITIYVEQIFAAELFLWHHRWAAENAARAGRNEFLLPLQASPKPTFLESYSPRKIVQAPEPKSTPRSGRRSR